VTSQAPWSHFGTNRKTWDGVGFESNVLLVTYTFTSCLPVSRASVNGSLGNFVGEGLAVEGWGDTGAVVAVSDVHEANTSTAATVQAACEKVRIPLTLPG